MSVPFYSYLFSDLATNRRLEELPLSDVQFGQTLNKSETFQGTLTLGNPRLNVKNPYDITTPCRRCVYVLRDGVPKWGGIIWTRSYDSTTNQVTIGAADWWSYFSHRKVLPVLALNQRADGQRVAPDPTYVANQPTTYFGIDQNQIARNLVTQAQAAAGGNIGIQLDGSLSGIIRQETYNGYDNTWVSDALANLANIIDGPDILFDVGPTDSAGRPTRLLRLGTPQLGAPGRPWRWELGGNLLSYQWPSDGTRYASRVFAAGNGTEEAALIQVSENRSRYDIGWPLAESETSYSTVSDPDDLQGHADSDQATSTLPVVVPQLVVRGEVWPTYDQIGVGDQGIVSIQDQFFTTKLTTAMRIVSANVSPAETVEKVTLSMNPLLEDVA